MRSITWLGLLLAIVVVPVGATERDIRNSIALGALAFADNCRACHQIDGYGEEELYPSLHSTKLLSNRVLLIKTILKGRMSHQVNGTGQPLMPSLEFLTNREISAIIAFISNSWGEEILLVTEEEIETARSSGGK